MVLLGETNFEQCKKNIGAILYDEDRCPKAPCSIDGVHQPSIRGNFYAMSMYFFAVGNYYYL